MDIEWIWHVHRLHPLDYYNDCIKGSYGGKLVDKKVARTLLTDYPSYSVEEVENSVRTSDARSFQPSIDLTAAVLRQCEFLDRFKEHRLFTADLMLIDESSFQNAVQNYISFIKLAKKDIGSVVPTYDIGTI